MTRNEAIKLLAREALLMFEHDGTSTLDGDITLEVINQSFDYFGEQLQDKDDEIALLKCRIEEAMNPKTCEGCKFRNTVKFVQVESETLECCSVCVRNCYDYYEPKDNA